MADRLNADDILNELQRSMALEESGANRPIGSGKRHINCDGHGCEPTCGYHGYCDYEATRHYNSDKGQVKGEYSKGERHDYYRRDMRL